MPSSAPVCPRGTHCCYSRRGNVRAVNEVANRIEGKPLQVISVGYEDSMEHMSDEELQQRIAELERQLGLTPCENKEKDSSRESPIRGLPRCS